MRKITRKGIVRKLDETLRKIVMVRDGECVTCPLWKKYKPDFEGSDVLQAGHLLTRGKGVIKYDLNNVYCQCKTCNFLHEGRPEFLTTYVIGVIGKKKYEDLVFKGNKAKPIKTWELQELLTELEKMLEKEPYYPHEVF